MGQLEHLPMTRVDIKVMIVDVSAHVMFSHTFENRSEHTTGSAKYVFPVPASAVVCGFEMETSDGKFILGVVKAKNEAEADYKAAVDSGKSAGLVNWAADDLFTISVGSVPPRTTVTTNLTCAMSLMDNASPEEVRFQLPVGVGTVRYGTPPVGTTDAGDIPASTHLRIRGTVQTGGELLDISSPSHGNKVTRSPYKNHHGRRSLHRTLFRMSSLDFLTADFLLVIRARNLDMPRCFAEQDVKRGTVALQLTIVPHFDIPRVLQQEYLFLVDRSGSMTGSRIETAKRALIVLLRALPSENTTFNIFSFGNHSDALWGQGQDYKQDTLTLATSHIASMAANYGGTEICAALQHVFSQRNTAVPTILYVLTDGQSSDIPATKATVATAVGKSSVQAPLRVFTLGIGDSASSAMCEGIARAGKGICLMAVDSNEIVPKCSALVRAGVRPLVADVKVDWQATIQKVALPGPNSGETVDGISLLPPPSVQQSPPQLGTLYRSRRFVAYVILTTDKVPKEVILHGKIQNGQKDLYLPVTVKNAKRFSTGEHTASFIHSLAARHIIQDIQENRTNLTAAVLGDPVKKAEVIRLGVRYQLVTEHTSFVGVEEGKLVADRVRERRLRRGKILSNGNQNPPRQAYTWTDYAKTVSGWITGALSSMLGTSVSTSRTPRMPRGFASRGTSSGPQRDSSGYLHDDDLGVLTIDDLSERDETAEEDGYSSTSTFSTISSLSSYSETEMPRSRRGRSRSNRVPPPPPRSPSPKVQASPRRLETGDTPVPGASRVQEDVLDLVMLQSFDGSFIPDPRLGRILGEDMLALGGGFGVTDEVWATALAVAYLERRLDDQRELLEGLLDKVEEFVTRTVGKGKFEELVQRAKGILV
ncbi:hypothetical protein OF83DRAFT_1092767, partial [Amylostereum chailletii]